MWVWISTIPFPLNLLTKPSPVVKPNTPDAASIWYESVSLHAKARSLSTTILFVPSRSMAEHYAEIFSRSDVEFLERHGRLLFLSYQTLSQ